MTLRLAALACMVLGLSAACLQGKVRGQELTGDGLVFRYDPVFDGAGAFERPILTLAAVGLSQEESSEGPRGTLFQWNSDSGNTGGPQYNDPLVTDRPDFTESSVAVGKGVVQIEFGYTFNSSTSGGETVRTQTAGEQLLRSGFHADWLEFRLGMIPGFMMDSIDGFDLSLPVAFEQKKSGGTSTSTAGFTDLYTGLKIALFPQEGNLPEMAVIPQMNIPTGSASFSSDKFEPGLNLVYSWAVDDSLATAGSTQVNRRIEDSGEDYLEFAQSWTLARSITERVGVFAEWYAFFPRSTDTARSEQYLNGGFAWAIRDFQFDIRIGFGLNDDSSDFFIGSGFSFRKL